MNSVPHYLHVYQKPALGSAFLKRYPALSYKHRILANGGFDTASCVLPVSRAEGETIFENYVGNRAAVYVNNPAEVAWEGLITRITFTLPGVVLTRSLDEMGNRASVNVAVGSDARPAVATTVSNAASQALYGIKQVTLRTARNAAAGATIATSLANRALNDVAYPLTSVAPNDGSVNSIIEIELKGFYYTLDWEPQLYAGNFTFRNGSTGHIDELLNNLLNGTTFLNNLDTSDLTNNATTHNNEARGGTVWQTMQAIAECGLNAQRWIVGVTPLNITRGTRRLYYRPASTDVKYLAKVNFPGRLFTPSGAAVQGWTAKPDGVVKVVDALVGWDGDGFDPRLQYIAALEYEADTGKVTWQSDDNIAIAGALQTDKFHSMSGQKYGQRASTPLM